MQVTFVQYKGYNFIFAKDVIVLQCLINFRYN